MIPLAVGIDLGTSGARAVAMTPAFEVVASGAAKLDLFGSNPRDPSVWWRAVEAALAETLAKIDPGAVGAIAVDGTSGTIVPIDVGGRPIAEPMMYNDPVDDPQLLSRVAPIIARDSAAHGPTSGLAKALHFQSVPGIAKAIHQADWIVGRFTGDFGATDENNALKTGYDPVERRWPEWIGETGLRADLLPRVVAPGDPIGKLTSEMTTAFGLDGQVIVVAGTTDGCASFLATGADRPGDGVTVLGSTLTVKLLCDRPIFAPDFGIYSHRINGNWLAGGASNSGGKVLAHFFSTDEIDRLSGEIDPEEETGLDYYPLISPGERFPIVDAAWPPRLTPRPPLDAEFLKGMLEGMAGIEQLGYARLAELGAPRLRSVRSVGGGAANTAWTTIRQRRLGVPFLPALSEEAAAGSARLALIGLRAAGRQP